MTAPANHPAPIIDVGPDVLTSGPGAIKLSPSAGEQKGGPVAYALCKASWAIHDYTSFYQWQLHPSKSKTDCGDPAETAVIIKRAARFLGADLVGITKARTPADFPFEVRSVIVMAIEMDYEACRSEPSLMATAATGLGYSRMAETASKLAVFIKELGYRAIPCGDDIAPSIPLAIKAGLGERGRNGLLVTKQYGARVRLCKIFTDLEIKADQPVLFGVKKFCASCRVCADACPARAISNAEQPEKWAVDTSRCARFWEDNATDCCRCIVSCPLNKPAAWEIDLNQSLADINLVSPFQPGVGSPRSKQRYVQSWWYK